MAYHHLFVLNYLPTETTIATFSVEIYTFSLSTYHTTLIFLASCISMDVIFTTYASSRSMFFSTCYSSLCLFSSCYSISIPRSMHLSNSKNRSTFLQQQKQIDASQTYPFLSSFICLKLFTNWDNKNYLLQ